MHIRNFSDSEVPLPPVQSCAKQECPIVLRYDISIGVFTIVPIIIPLYTYNWNHGRRSNSELTTSTYLKQSSPFQKVREFKKSGIGAGFKEDQDRRELHILSGFQRVRHSHLIMLEPKGRTWLGLRDCRGKTLPDEPEVRITCLSAVDRHASLHCTAEAYDIATATG